MSAQLKNQATMEAKSVRKIALLLVILASSFAHAQDPLTFMLMGIGGNYLQRQLFPNHDKEYGAGKIVFNVYDVRDGQRKFLNCWDPSTGTAQAWKAGVELVPVLIPNESGTIGEVQWALSTENGPLVKQQHNQVKGGRPDRDGHYKDNSGYVQPPYSLCLADLPQGVIGVTGSWGKGKSATVQLMNMDVARFYQMIDADEDLRGQFAGSGTGTFPQVPIHTAIIDGLPHYFTSGEEAQAYIDGLNNRAKRTALGATGNGGAGQGGQGQQPQQGPWQGEYRLGFYYTDFTSEVVENTAKLNPSTETCAEIPQGKKLAVVLDSEKPFGIAVIDGNQKVLATIPAVQVGQGHWQLTKGIQLSNAFPARAIVIAEQGHPENVTVLQLKPKN